MIYKTNHGDLNYVYTGENYHQGIKHYYKYAYVCEDCREEVSVQWQIIPCSGPPCDNRAE